MPSPYPASPGPAVETAHRRGRQRSARPRALSMQDRAWQRGTRFRSRDGAAGPGADSRRSASITGHSMRARRSWRQAACQSRAVIEPAVSDQLSPPATAEHAPGRACSLAPSTPRPIGAATFAMRTAFTDGHHPHLRERRMLPRAGGVPERRRRPGYRVTVQLRTRRSSAASAAEARRVTPRHRPGDPSPRSRPTSPARATSTPPGGTAPTPASVRRAGTTPTGSNGPPTPASATTAHRPSGSSTSNRSPPRSN